MPVEPSIPGVPFTPLLPAPHNTATAEAGAGTVPLLR